MVRYSDVENTRKLRVFFYAYYNNRCTIIQSYESADKAIVFSKKGKNRMVNTLNKRIDYAERGKTYKPVKGLWKRIAVAALVAIMVLFTACMCVEKIREAIVDFFVEWYDEYIRVEDNYEPSAEVVDNQVPPPPNEILEYREPSNLEDYNRQEFVKNKFRYYIEYDNGTESLLYEQNLIEEYLVFVSNENTEMKEIAVNEYQGVATMYYAGDILMYTICWRDNQYSYMINGNLDYDFMLSIAESVYE